MSRRRRQRDVVKLLEEAGFNAWPLDQGRVIATHTDVGATLIHVETRRRCYPPGLHERWALHMVAGQFNAKPFLAWWPRGREVPEWTAL